MTFRFYSIAVRCANTHFQGQIWGDFYAILERMLVWRTPNAVKEVPSLEMFLGQR